MRKSVFYNESTIKVRTECFEYQNSHRFLTRYLINLPKNFINKDYPLYVIFFDDSPFAIDTYDLINKLRPHITEEEYKLPFHRLPFDSYATRSTYQAYELLYADPVCISDFLDAQLLNRIVTAKFLSTLHLSIFEEAIFNHLKPKRNSDNIFTLLDSGKFRLWLEHYNELDMYFELIKRIYENPFHSKKIDSDTKETVIDIYTHYFKEKKKNKDHYAKQSNLVTL